MPLMPPLVFTDAPTSTEEEDYEESHEVSTKHVPQARSLERSHRQPVELPKAVSAALPAKIPGRPPSTSGSSTKSEENRADTAEEEERETEEESRNMWPWLPVNPARPELGPTPWTPVDSVAPKSLPLNNTPSSENLANQSSDVRGDRPRIATPNNWVRERQRASERYSSEDSHRQYRSNALDTIRDPTKTA
ncbi:hypothetical protein HDU96_010255 [Phlyctochytrium bullatum]|nr:hypothetical protein HDU96_010255 [Phlyctochytrium bullatum]